MKTTKNQAAQRPAQEQPSQDTAMGEDSRLRQLMDLAHDGDEIAAAELELHYALVS